MVVGIWARTKTELPRPAPRRSRRSKCPLRWSRDRGAGARGCHLRAPGEVARRGVEDAEVPDPVPNDRATATVPSGAFPCVFRRAAGGGDELGSVVLRGDARRRSRRACACWTPTSTTAPATTRRATTRAGGVRAGARRLGTVGVRTKNNNPWMPARGMPFERARVKGSTSPRRRLSRREASHRRVARLLLVVGRRRADSLCARRARSRRRRTGSRAGVSVPPDVFDRRSRATPRFVRFKRYGDDSQCAPLRLRATSTLTDRDYCRFTILCPPMITRGVEGDVRRPAGGFRRRILSGFRSASRAGAHQALRRRTARGARGWEYCEPSGARQGREGRRARGTGRGVEVLRTTSSSRAKERARGRARGSA